MFDNKIDPITTEDELTFSHHTFKEMYDMGWTSRALLVLVVLIFLYLVIETILELIEDESKIHAQDNKLPAYFDSLKATDCKEFLEDEELAN
jgi:hypothetical protein